VTLLLLGGREDSFLSPTYAEGEPCPCCGASADVIEENAAGAFFCPICEEAWTLEDAA